MAMEIRRTLMIRDFAGESNKVSAMTGRDVRDL